MTNLTTVTIEDVTQILYNYAHNNSKYSLLSTPHLNSKCIQNRLYSTFYILIKHLHSTYLRFLICPSILLNILCLIVLSRPRLSKKSTTICYLRALALFDMFCITLKYFRAELNYQSAEKGHNIFLLKSTFCKILYVLLSTSISVDIWIIVLMSLDKLIAVRYPLKSTVLLTPKRAYTSTIVVISVLFCINLYFIHTADIKLKGTKKYCTVITESVLIDLVTASFLPIGIITGANIYIAIVLRNATRRALAWNETTCRKAANTNNTCRVRYNKNKKHFMTFLNKRKRTIDFEYDGTFKQQQHYSSCLVQTSSNIDGEYRLSIEHNNTINVVKRTSIQVTRMLLAVTSSLIILNIPNTLFFSLIKIYDPRLVLHDPNTMYRSLRSCSLVTDKDLSIYKFGIYSSLLQNILSDLPHVVNFFIYCFAGKKFRIIFKNEVLLFFQKINLLHKTNTTKYCTSVLRTIDIPKLSRTRRAPSLSSINKNFCHFNQVRSTTSYVTKKLTNKRSISKPQLPLIVNPNVKNKSVCSRANKLLIHNTSNTRNKRQISRETNRNQRINLLVPELSLKSDSDISISNQNLSTPFNGAIFSNDRAIL
ncbi:unnamed protein product [Didymodactylos carnosus]|uniref:G-protein coupled receptors family 1 profile domain-containing protein n=1 Tax=Didymodactylos carnosus TaxID=1234261 RepID=A0A813ZQ18_9BILA|nr:unnamed protein product [Didymodactylos carnosus]CAF3685720.1 unnamed protein product [Didymodactylos carnosus]